MKRIRVGYWGFSEDVLELLIHSEEYELVYVATQQDKIDNRFRILCKEDGVPCHFVTTKNELKSIYQNYFVKNIIVYCFGIIIPKDIYEDGVIINIHPGSIYTNRGAHALLWSILLSELDGELNAYRICCNEIDSGELISVVRMKCLDDDTPFDLLNKLNRKLPQVLSDISEYLRGIQVDYPKVFGGTYRHRVEEIDYTINIERDNKSIIKRKINSQISYDGAILCIDNERIRIVRYEELQDRLRMFAKDGRCFDYNG